MPRYYKDKLFSEVNFPDAITAKAIRKAIGQKMLKKMEEAVEKYKRQKDYEWNKVQSDLDRFRQLKQKGNNDKKIF